MGIGRPDCFRQCWKAVTIGLTYTCNILIILYALLCVCGRLTPEYGVAKLEFPSICKRGQVALSGGDGDTGRCSLLTIKV